MDRHFAHLHLRVSYSDLAEEEKAWIAKHVIFVIPEQSEHSANGADVDRTS